MKAFRASAAGGYGVTADTPRQAALALFDKHPEKRKCDVIEGEDDEHSAEQALNAYPNGVVISTTPDMGNDYDQT